MHPTKVTSQWWTVYVHSLNIQFHFSFFPSFLTFFKLFKTFFYKVNSLLTTSEHALFGKGSFFFFHLFHCFMLRKLFIIFPPACGNCWDHYICREAAKYTFIVYNSVLNLIKRPPSVCQDCTQSTHFARGLQSSGSWRKRDGCIKRPRRLEEDRQDTPWRNEHCLLGCAFPFCLYRCTEGHWKYNWRKHVRRA